MKKILIFLIALSLIVFTGINAYAGQEIIDGVEQIGTINTSGTPVANDMARFIDADTIEGRSYAEVLSDLSLDANLKDLTAAEIGQLENIGDITLTYGQWGYLGACTAAGGELINDAAASNQRTTLGLVIGTDVQGYGAAIDTDNTDDAEKDAAANISGTWEWQDDIKLTIGNDADWEIYYNEASTDSLIFTTTAFNGSADNVGMFRIVVNDANGTLDADQMILQIMNYATQIFGLDTEGDLFVHSVTADRHATPAASLQDADCTDSDINAQFLANATTTGSGAEIIDLNIKAQIGGSLNIVAEWDGSDEAWILGDSATGEDLKLDLDTGTANQATISSNSGLTELNFSAINLLTTGSLAGRPVITTAGTERVLTAAECSGGIVLVTAAIEVRLPDVCDSATGAFVMIVQADASEVVQIAVTDTAADHIFLNGVDLGVNFEIDSPGDAVEDNYICMWCREANEWHSMGRSGTWVTGGAAD